MSFVEKGFELSEKNCNNVTIKNGKKSPYGYAAYSISQLEEPLSKMRWDLQKLKGVGKATEGIIKEILDTGSSSYLERLLVG